MRPIAGEQRARSARPPAVTANHQLPEQADPFGTGLEFTPGVIIRAHGRDEIDHTEDAVLHAQLSSNDLRPRWDNSVASSRQMRRGDASPCAVDDTVVTVDTTDTFSSPGVVTHDMRHGQWDLLVQRRNAQHFDQLVNSAKTTGIARCDRIHC